MSDRRSLLHLFRQSANVEDRRRDPVLMLDPFGFYDRPLPYLRAVPAQTVVAPSVALDPMALDAGLLDIGGGR